MLSFSKHLFLRTSIRSFSFSSYLIQTQNLCKKFSAERIVKSLPKPMQPYLLLARMDKPIGLLY